MPRASYTIQQKLDVLRKVEKNNNLDKTARELNINRRTIQKWRASKQQLLSEATKTSGANSRRICVKRKMEGGKYKELEVKLSDFIKERRENRMTVYQADLKKIALELFTELNYEGTFKASRGWIHRFLQRNNFTNREVTGKAQKIMSSTSNTQCCVRPCSNKSVFHKNRLQSTYFHTFPNQHKHPARYASWLAFVRCHRKEFKSGRGFYVCSDHFTWDDYVDTRQYDFNTASGDSAQTVILILKPDAVPSIAPIPRQPPAPSKAALERAQCKLDKDHDEYIASVQGSANEKLVKTATIGGKVDQWISHQPNNRGDNDSCTLASSVSINQTQAEDEHTSAEEHNNIITTDIADIKRPLQTHLIEEPHVTPLVKERLRPPLIGTPPYPPLIETPPPPLPLKDYKPTDLELSAYQLHMIAAGENNSHITTQIQSRIGSIYPKKEPIDEYYAYPPYYFL